MRREWPRLQRLHFRSEDATGFGWDLDWNEILCRIEIVFTGFVNDSNVVVAGSSLIRQHGVYLARFKRLRIAAIVNAQCERTNGPISGCHLTSASRRSGLESQFSFYFRERN